MWHDWVYALNDPADRFLAEDKLQHLGWAAFAFAIGLAKLGLGVPGALATVVVASLLVEGIEVARWYMLGVLGRQAVLSHARPWPAMCDRVSLKDLAVDALGAGLGWVCLA